MDFIETLLWPLRWLVELVLAVWHQIFTFFGLNPASGLTWVLSIIGLVLVVRSALIPITVRQIKSQRRMMDLAPEMKKIQAKYKGKTDQFSREAMSRETMALYKKHGTNPFSSCLPILIQMPVFFSLFYVLRHAAENKTGIGFMNQELTHNFNAAELFGAPLKMTFTQGWAEQNWVIIILLGVIMVLMIASQFFTQLQIMSKNVSDETKNSPMYRQQKILLYIIPFAFIFSGVTFPLALNIYWFTSNLWTMGQQYIVIKNMPTPGSEAWRQRQARLKAKGKLTEEEAAEIERIEGSAEPQGQRQQPMSAKRAKKKK
ncbi:membrane protein insertase YidC [Leucobacter sp. OLJS4]|uniref:membrane protein insertase YidC n=1 Tax=unclassified Leucobacter TaxID=2621730 RepID=UPI000C193979|nr:MULTISPECIES: membrane protein insertase YidC [unclassified Leucobacter]PIJ54186.1 membrane protein insertase YidC [Leucobacter sp. OLES1]PII82481.1 membrane protein insertase YidC [Leucobacter sp. OLCALW19]PII87336.1 membrane protein insertase YidC [Leucobacter sp. OLTLW20]PII94608.1 membrane protein insertase YidC [Leucobacter sp. OLAS13]PIJ00594.1 membrane protein insertase YidC [Leucobacter sp. OLDS2]